MTIKSAHRFKVDTLIGLTKEVERFCTSVEKNNYELPLEISNQIKSRCEEIVDQCDEMPVPSRVRPSAEAVADCAYLLGNALHQAEAREVTVHEVGRVGAIETLKPGVVVERNTFQNVVNYMIKAVETLKYPSGYYQCDDSGLYVEGGFYL